MSEEGKQLAINNEFDLVKNAFYTDPADQSAWLYELWLVGRGNDTCVCVCEQLHPIH